MITTPVQNRKGKEAVAAFRNEFTKMMRPLTSKEERAQLYSFVLHLGNCASSSELLARFKAIAVLPQENQKKVFSWFQVRGRLVSKQANAA